MNKMGKSKLWVILACLLLQAPSLNAQVKPGEDAEAKEFYEELIRTPIVPQRSSGDIKDDLSVAEKDMQQVDAAIAESQERIKEAQGWLATQKKEIDRLKDKIKAAKKDKREADKLTLEAQKKQLELVEEYLKKTKEIRDAELDYNRAQKEKVGAEIKVYQGELDLKNRVDAIRNSAPEDPNLSRIVFDAAQAGENVLKLIKTMADKNKNVSDRMKKLADRRIKLAQARNKLLSEERIRQAAEKIRE